MYTYLCSGCVPWQCGVRMDRMETGLLESRSMGKTEELSRKAPVSPHTGSLCITGSFGLVFRIYHRASLSYIALILPKEVCWRPGDASRPPQPGKNPISLRWKESGAKGTQGANVKHLDSPVKLKCALRFPPSVRLFTNTCVCKSGKLCCHIQVPWFSVCKTWSLSQLILKTDFLRVIFELQTISNVPGTLKRLFPSSDSPRSLVWLESPFHRWGLWGSVRSGTLPKVTQLGSSSGRVWIQAAGPQRPCP